VTFIPVTISIVQLTVKATIRLLNWKAFLRIVIDIIDDFSNTKKKI